MRLQRLVLRDFKGFAELDVTMAEGPCTLFIGRNGSGKSSLIEGVQLLLDAAMAAASNSHPQFSARSSDVRHGARGLLLRADFADGTIQVGWPTAAPLVGSGVDALSDAVRRGTLPVLVGMRTDRTTSDLGHLELDLTQGTDRLAEDPRWGRLPDAWRLGLVDRMERFAYVIPWFRREENLENEVRLRRDPAYRHPSLEVIRGALSRFWNALEPSSKFQNPRISRVDASGGPLAQATDGTLVIDKDRVPLTLDQLSDGERFVIVLVCDLARRLFLANPGATDPLAGFGIVVIDEIEQHLHPAWQVRLLPALIAAFPGLQFIATTHSPSVVTSVPGESVRLLDGFQAHPIAATYGRDSNSLLTHVFGGPTRPQEVQARIGEVVRHIDADDLNQARNDLDGLARVVTEDDPEVVRLRSLLSFLAS